MSPGAAAACASRGVRVVARRDRSVAVYSRSYLRATVGPDLILSVSMQVRKNIHDVYLSQCSISLAGAVVIDPWTQIIFELIELQEIHMIRHTYPTLSCRTNLHAASNHQPA